MYNQDCEKCLGKGHYEVPNYRLEITERIDCMDCLLEERFKIELKEQLTRLLANTSHAKLAQIVAELIINSVDSNPLDDLERIEGIIHTKNTVNAIALASAYAGQ
tara:strand:- start:136 stop:450 length:315 start_codon:yes stop_codon:yes gene_type:complete